MMPSNPLRAALERIARGPQMTTCAGAIAEHAHVTRIARDALAAQEPAGNTDADRFRWWFSRPARRSRSLDEWRDAIDKAMQAEEGPEETRLYRQLLASLDVHKMKQRPS